MSIHIRSERDRQALLDAYASGRGYKLQELKVYLTGRCNLSCAMCGKRDKVKHPDMPFSLFTDVVEQACELGLRRIKFFGGEPTLRDDLVGWVSYCSSRRVGVRITTNGTLLSEGQADELVAAGLERIIVSVDSPRAETHDAIRGVPGTLRRAIRGIVALDQARERHRAPLQIEVNCVLMRDNVRDLPALAARCAEWGVDALTLVPATPNNPREALVPQSTEAQLFQRFTLSPDEIVSYNHETAPRLLRMCRRHGIRLPAEHAYAFGNTGEQIQRASHGRYVDHLLADMCCLKPWYYPAIDGAGRLIACNRVKDRSLFPIGSAAKTPLRELWNNERYRRFRQRCKAPSFPECHYCCYTYALLLHEQTKTLGLADLRPAEPSAAAISPAL